VQALIHNSRRPVTIRVTHVRRLDENCRSRRTRDEPFHAGANSERRRASRALCCQRLASRRRRSQWMIRPRCAEHANYAPALRPDPFAMAGVCGRRGCCSAAGEAATRRTTGPTRIFVELTGIRRRAGSNKPAPCARAYRPDQRRSARPVWTQPVGLLRLRSSCPHEAAAIAQRALLVHVALDVRSEFYGCGSMASFGNCPKYIRVGARILLTRTNKPSAQMQGRPA